MACRWIESFLSEIKQRVYIHGNYSRWHNVTSGIPQGPVQGHILFVIFINDFPESAKSEEVLLADDTSLFSDIRTESDFEIL